VALKSSKKKPVAKKPVAKKAVKSSKPVAKATKKPAAKPVKVSAKVITKKAPVVKVAPKKLPPTPPKKPVLVTPKNTTSKQFTQSELFECIKGYCGFEKRTEAKNYYSGFVGMIQGALKSGYKVVLPGLGKIQVKKTKARMGRNPATGQPMMIPAKKKVSFTVLKAMKESVL